MANQLKVAWFNGLNIDKIHFEQQERYFQRNIDLKTIEVLRQNCIRKNFWNSQRWEYF